MRAFLRFLLWSLLILAALGAGLFGYFVYSPSPEVPHLTGTLAHGTIEFGGRPRTYLTYVPRDLPKGSPLVIVMHGSGQDGAQMRMWTGYAFERLADERGFALVYPDAFEGYWNACNIVGDYSANKLDIDDVGFISALAAKIIAEQGVDPARVFAAGGSRGGQMALRLALEAPARFRAVAAMSASVPTPDNFKCRPAAGGTPSVLIMNGTDDPLNPFNGGKVKFYGFLYRGTVLSSRESARYFAAQNAIAAEPSRTETIVADGVRVETLLWQRDAKTEIELVAIHGSGHGIPQPYWRNPRLLGPSPKEPNGPALVWDFFARQTPR